MANQAIILVGGRGERLGSLTENKPKPMMSIGTITFLEVLIKRIASYGFKEILLLCGYYAEAITSVFDGKFFGDARIFCIVENQPMGTAGALQVASEFLEEHFLLLNGDSLLDMNLLDLMTIAPNQNWVGKVALRQLEDTGRFGTVTMDGERITSFAEKTGNGSGLINGGIYLLKREILELIPPSTPYSLERDVLPQLAKKGLLFGRAYQGYFIDIGIPEDLARAQREIPNRKRPAVFFDRDGVLNQDHGYVHRPEDFDWVDGAIQSIKLFNDNGWLVFVVTNQAGVARGYYDESQVHSLHAWIQDELRQHGAHIDAFYYCPHHPEGTVSALTKTCTCRKPEPGMLLAALQEWPVDTDRSILIGDKESDIEAAKQAGITGILFTGTGLYEIVSRLCKERTSE